MPKQKKVCLTPGAYYYTAVDRYSRRIKFSVSMPIEVIDKIDERRMRRIEKAFHDAIEPILGPIWPKQKK
jgi:hypothetical protein